MTYTALALVAIPVAVVMDLAVLRTRLLTTRTWWLTYAVLLGFQLLTNGWLTGRGIVRYADGAILGSGRIAFVGAGRLVWAPVEDLGFGFALVLLSCAWWVRLRPRGED